MREMMGGSQEALAALYDRHGGAVYAMAMRASRDPSIAAEVVQDTFLILWNRAERFDPSLGTLPSWLRTIARNRAVDHLRVAARGRATTFASFGRDGADQSAIDDWLLDSGELVGMADGEPGPEAALADKETRASMAAAIASLDPLERSVITLAYGTGLSQAEIATHLGWPLGTVKTRTRRALRHLRARLEGPRGVGVGGGVDQSTRVQSVPDHAAARPAADAGGRTCWPPRVASSAAPLASGCH